MLNIDNILKTRFQLKQHDRIIVGVSAGPDSVALLHLLSQSCFNLRLSCVYIDHGLRPDETPAEKNLVMELCSRLDIPAEIIAVNALQHRHKYKLSLEEACRVLRYQALEDKRIQFNAKAVAVGHTADDQSEEILLRLLRGSGLTGLSGMRWQRDYIIRPLLDFSKSDLVRYLEDHKIAYCIDSSNRDSAFLRNRIRHDLIPRLEQQYNESIRTTLLKTAEILQTDDNFIEAHVESAMKQCVTSTNDNIDSEPSHRLELKIFLTIHPAIQRRVIEKLCCKNSCKPNYSQITGLCKLSIEGKTGAGMHLDKGVRVEKTTDALCFFSRRKTQENSLRSSTIIPPIEPVEIVSQLPVDVPEFEMRLDFSSHESKPAELPEGSIVLDADKVQFPLILRHHKPGEKFTPAGMQGSKKISRFLSDLKVPKFKRNMHPVLAFHDTIVAVVGLRADSNCCVSAQTNRFLVVSWQKKPA